MSEDDDDAIDLLGGSYDEDSADPEEEDGAETTEDVDTDAEPRDGGTEPLGDLAERLNREDQEALETGEDVFEEVDTGAIDVEDVWEQLESGPGPEGETLGEGEDVRRIERSVCHGCPHFGDPPELHCTHDGTTIREMPDSQHFVVVECPVVAGEEDI